jgi:hypothetical protein
VHCDEYIFLLREKYNIERRNERETDPYDVYMAAAAARRTDRDNTGSSADE